VCEFFFFICCGVAQLQQPRAIRVEEAKLPRNIESYRRAVMRLQFLPAVLLLASCLAAVHGRREGAPNFIHCSPVPPPPLANFSQLLNHTDLSSPLFNQRFQYFDLRPHAVGDPVLFYAGPENAANAYTMSCTALLQFAQQLNASGIIAAEHRFFGTSWPDDLTKDNYRAVMSTLTLSNILADYAAIIKSFTRQGGHYDGGRVIVFGGSYGGFLAAMMRLSHADAVFAAVASASPVHLTGSGVDTGLWYDTVARVFAQQDGGCAGAVSAAFADLKSALDAGNFSNVQQQLDLCAMPTAPLVGEFMILAMHAAQIITQFNYPFKAAAKIPFPFQSFCAEISAKPHPALSDLRLLLDLGYNNSGALRCFGPKQQQLQTSQDTHAHTHTPPDAPPQPPPSLRSAFSDISFEMSWYYITCTFFGLPIAAGAASQSFFSYSYPYNLPAINNYCQTTLFWSGVALQQPPPINEAIIGNSSRIIFSNQDFDPVAPFSLSRSLSDTLLLLNIPNASHTQDVVAYDDQVVQQRCLGIIIHPCVYAFSIHDKECRSKHQSRNHGRRKLIFSRSGCMLAK
jgi:pimeloyl-ACP methyl ester carboxylesterase